MFAHLPDLSRGKPLSNGQIGALRQLSNLTSVIAAAGIVSLVDPDTAIRLADTMNKFSQELITETISIPNDEIKSRSVR